MSDIITPLSQDEETVLTIAAQGQSLMAIGRWEKPVDRLMSLGYLSGSDRFNAGITSLGMSALQNVQDESISQAMSIAGKINGEQTAMRNSIEEAAKGLIELARRSALSTGDRPSNCARQWGKVLIDRAVEMLETGHD